MSLSFQKLQPVEVRDPRTILENVRSYAILKAGSQTTWKQWTSTSISSSSIQFSTPPPSQSVIVDPKMYFYLPVRLTFIGTPPLGQPIIQANYDAPREWPISGSIDILQATINNQSVSINLADVIHALSHFNTDVTLKNGDYSLSPNYPDQSQQYSDLLDNVRNPLGGYGDSLDETVMPRGGFSFIVVNNPIQTASPGVALTAVIDVAFCEPIFLPPFYFGEQNRSGFYNVNSIDFNITFLGNAGFRMWSHNDQNGTSPITSIAVNFGGTTGGPSSFQQGGNLPLILTQYITPQETQILSPNQPLSYPYFDIQRYPTGQSPVGAGANATLNSNNIQLSSIPRRMYIYVRDSNQELYNSCTLTDTYFSIQNISIQFMNKNGLLASASPMQLYEMSKKNHCQLSWTQWSGNPVCPLGAIPSGAGPFTPFTDFYIYPIGSIVCLEFATDIGLESLEAPGKLGQYQLQVTVQATNISNRMITPTLYLVPILEGVFCIPSHGRALINIGVITSQDILDSKNSPWLNYNDVENVSGGDFFSGIKSFFSDKVLPALKQFVSNHGISRTLGSIPHPYSQIASNVANAVGLGEGDREDVMAGEGEGGVLLGGRHMSKTQLKRRMKHY